MNIQSNRESRQNKFAARLEYFIQKYLPFERNLSPRTVKSYKEVFIQFILFMDERQGVRPDKLNFKHLTRESVQDFLNYLHGKGLKSTTCNHRHAVICAFVRLLQYYEVEYLAQWGAILNMPKMKTEQPVIAYLSVEAVRMLLDAPDQTTREGRRHYLILAILYDLGLRVQELADLTVRDIRLYEDQANFNIMGKGCKGRLVPSSGIPSRVIQDYLQEWDLTGMENASHPLFFNARGTKLSRSGITYILKTYAEGCRKTRPDLIPENISCHKLRHSKAMHLLQNGVNLIYIRDLLGHSSEKTTEIYARVGSSFKDEALKKAYEGTTLSMNEAPRWKTDSGLLERLKRL